LPFATLLMAPPARNAGRRLRFRPRRAPPRGAGAVANGLTLCTPRASSS